MLRKLFQVRVCIYLYRLCPVLPPSSRHLFLGGGLGKVRKSLTALELGILNHACRVSVNGHNIKDCGATY
jgi:hypothetical protein